MSHFLKFQFIPFLLALTLWGWTYTEFSFHVLPPKKLSAEDFKGIKKPSYGKFYTVNVDPVFKVELGSDPDAPEATLLWPETPFQRIAVLVPEVGESVNIAKIYSGRILPCILECKAGDAIIDLKSYREILVKKFPDRELNPSSPDLPRFLLNTTIRPKGILYYFNENTDKLLVLGLTTLLCEAGYIYSFFKRKRLK